MNSYLKSRLYIPKTHQEYWCNKCDTEVVDSQEPESGDFFVFFGHTYSAKSREYDDNYVGVMLALCKTCSE